MTVMIPPIECLNAPGPTPSESATGAATRRGLAFWGMLFVVLHVLIGFCLQHPPALKAFVPEAWWTLLAAKALELIILALLVPILLARDGLTLADIGFGSARREDVRLGVLGGAVIWFMHDSLLKLGVAVSGVAGINSGMLSTVRTLSDAPIELGGLIFATVVVGPLLEEIVYRGALMSSVRANLGTGPLAAFVAAAASGLIFAAFHGLGHPLYYAAYFLTGLALALFYRSTGSLWASVVAHGVVNGLFSVRIGLQACGLQ